MKKLFVFCVLMLTLQFSFSQTGGKQENPNLDPAKVPTAVVTKFTTDYPGVTAVWKADGENFKASFNDPISKLGRMIVYDKDGKVIRKESEVDESVYPKQIGEFYNKNYPGEKYQVWSSEDSESGQMLYYSGRNMEIMWFDKDGTKVPERKAKNNEPKQKKN